MLFRIVGKRRGEIPMSLGDQFDRRVPPTGLPISASGYSFRTPRTEPTVLPTAASFGLSDVSDLRGRAATFLTSKLNSRRVVTILRGSPDPSNFFC